MHSPLWFLALSGLVCARRNRENSASSLTSKSPEWGADFFSDPNSPLRRLGDLYGWGKGKLSVPGHGTQSWLYMPIISLALKDLESKRDEEYGHVGSRLKVPEDQERFWREHASDAIDEFRSNFESNWESLSAILMKPSNWGGGTHLDGQMQEQVEPPGWRDVQGAMLLVKLTSIQRDDVKEQPQPVKLTNIQRDDVKEQLVLFPDNLFDEAKVWRRCISYIDGTLTRDSSNLQDNLKCQRPQWEHNASVGGEAFWELSVVASMFGQLGAEIAIFMPTTDPPHFGRAMMQETVNFLGFFASTRLRQAILLYAAWGAFLQHVEALVPPNRGLGFDAHDMWYRLSTTDVCSREDGCVVVCMKVLTLGINFLACYELRSDLPNGIGSDFTGDANPRGRYGFEVPKLLHYEPELAGLDLDVVIISPATIPLHMQSLRKSMLDARQLETKIAISKASAHEAGFCFGTWNLGSEQQISFGNISVGPGVGSGGATQNDLIAGLRDILQRCAVADFIAVTLQEIDDLRLPAYVELLLDQLNQVSILSGRQYEYLGLVYAEQRSVESSAPLHSHTDRIASSGDQGVVVFAFGLADRIVQANYVQAYSVSFGKSKFGRKTLRKAMGTSAHKGGAILRVPALLPSSRGMVEMMVCFAGVHMDAKKESKREMSAKRMVAAMQSERCDVAVVAGDFNPRISSESCCPIQQVAWLMERQRDHELIELIVSQDEIRNQWRNQEWWFLQEQAIEFLPSFHKFAERSSGPLSAEEVLDDYGNQFIGPYKSEDYAIKQCPEPGSPEQEAERMIRVLGSADYNRSNYDWYWKEHACDELKHEHVCYGGIFTSSTCKRNLCYNIHDRSHCPGYADRVFFGDARIRKDDFELLFIDKFYTSLEHVSGGDHTPVVAMFSVVVSVQKDLVFPPIRPRTEIDDEAWIRSMENWSPRSIIWPNGSGRLCQRKNGIRMVFTKVTGCPRYESCYEIADNEKLDQIRNKTFETTEEGMVKTYVDWTKDMLHPTSECRKNAGGTWGVCASNVHHCATMLTI